MRAHQPSLNIRTGCRLIGKSAAQEQVIKAAEAAGTQVTRVKYGDPKPKDIITIYPPKPES